MFKLLNEMKKATNFENEIRERLSNMDRPNALCRENLELQIFALNYDIQRYRKQGFSNGVNWITVANSMSGIVDIYDRVLEDGIKKWQDAKFLKELFEEISIHKKECRVGSAGYYRTEGQQKAVVGLQSGQLYYDWSDDTMPVKPNALFISALRKKGLLQ